MKTRFLMLVLLLAGALAGCVDFGGWRSVKGSGNTMTETRAVSGFDQVSVSGAGELTLAQGDQESLTIEADDNLLPLIRSDVQGGHLSIGPQNVNLRPTRTIRYQVTVKHLSALHLSGSVRAEAGALKTKRLTLGISGSGRIIIAQL